MIRYIAVLWDEQAAELANECIRRARLHHSSLKVALRAPGLIVLVSTGASDPEPQLLCGDDGVLIGTLFSAPGMNTEGDACERAVLSPSDEKRIVATGGRALVENYWGNYVAVVRRRDDKLIRVIRGPFARLSCLHSAVDGVRLYASDMDALAQLRIRLHSVSWPALARTFLGPEPSGACHLNEVRELPAGAFEDASANRCSRQRLWNPASIASEPFHGGDAEAAGALRSATRACVQAWAREYSHVLVGLSGGLDSSVTLSCLADAPTQPRITAVTQFGEDRESDERVYARLMARRAGCELIEVPRTTDADLRACEYSAVFETSPGLRLPSVDRIEPEIAHRLGASAIFRGHGGDEIFCRNQPSLYLMDFLRQRGMSTGCFDLVTHAASVEGITVWSVLLRALWNRLRPGRLHFSAMLAPDLGDATLLRQDVLNELIEHEPAPDAMDAEDHSLPPGRRWQIHLLCARRNLAGPFDVENDPDVLCPLLSQPLVELCLRIPTWLQMTGHTDRALTRAAFASDLPAEILSRLDKGGAERMATEILYGNLPYLRERLLDGLVVQSGIIDRRRLEASLSAAPSLTSVSSAPLFELLGAEIWSSAWRDFNAFQRPIFTESETPRNASRPIRLA